MTGLLDPSQIEYCPLCHLCPAPLGVCCFIWAAVILLALIVLVALTVRKHRCPVCGCRVKKKTRRCPDCGYNFITGEPPAYARHIFNDRAGAAGVGGIVTPTEVKTCPACGAALPTNATFCLHCGQKQE